MINPGLRLELAQEACFLMRCAIRDFAAGKSIAALGHLKHCTRSCTQLSEIDIDRAVRLHRMYTRLWHDIVGDLAKRGIT